MVRVILLLVLLFFAVPSCSKIAGMLLNSGGPSLSANVQAGKTNTQTVGSTTIKDQKITAESAGKISQSADQTQIKSDSVGTVNQTNNQVWLILAFAVALFLDSPARWPGQIYNALRRGKKNTA